MNGNQKILAAGLILGVIAAACSSAASPTATPVPPTVPPPPTATAPPASPTAAALAEPTADPPRPAGATPVPTPAPTAVPARLAPALSADLSPEDVEQIRYYRRLGWTRTDFNKFSVDYGDIITAQVKDGIRSVDEPLFESFAEGDAWLPENVPVLGVEIGGQARAYPLAILTWHEIVNDTIGGVPIAATFCPLCNAAVVFERTVNGQVLEFGVSGNLINSDLVMFDRQTDSWWQQVTGEAIVGELTGERLTVLPASIVSYGDFKAAFPDGLVLSRQTGHEARYGNIYGSNPYVGYDAKDETPFLFRGRRDDRLQMMERIVGISVDGEDIAYPFEVLQAQGVVNDTVGGAPVVVLWRAGTTSALDARSIADSRDVGSTGVYTPVVEGQLLTFAASEDGFVDEQTGSTWNIFGHATAGPLSGQRLLPIVHADHFWFAWAAFRPDTAVYSSG